MAKRIIRVTDVKKEAIALAKAVNKNFAKRGIRREAYVTDLSYGYVRSLTRPGYPVANKNYGVAVRDK